ncbi:MAG: hypothetical protein ACJAYU_000884 [Bradymonadia bacterium]
MVGEVPAGLSNVIIEFAARPGADGEIVLRDGSLGVVSWPAGLLNGPTEERITYGGVTVVYSGCDGIDDDLGFERIQLIGTLEVPLSMYVFGYQADFADLEYSWGGPDPGTEPTPDDSFVDEFNGPKFSLPLRPYDGPAVDWWFDDGALNAEPHELSLWFHETTGPSFSMPMTGTFRVKTTVLTRRSASPSLRLDRHYQFASVMIRDPASNLDFTAMNWVFSVIGHRGTYTAVEHKNTYEGLSTVWETQWVDSDAELQICQVGAAVLLLERPIGSPTLLLAQEFDQPDLPATLEAGLIVCSWTDPFDMRASLERFELTPIESLSECFDEYTGPLCASEPAGRVSSLGRSS